ncbi:SGNH/GDSL hydrolase family protein, partial [Serratia sp. IR-2025]
MTYNTGNPLGSTDPRDLFDNAQNFDKALNEQVDTWVDRKGVVRYTWAGALKNIAPLGHPWTEDEANSAIASG